MKIDDLIKELESVREEHGNLELKTNVNAKVFLNIDLGRKQLEL